MKTKKKPTIAMQLPGALALAAAGAATHANAATVQITFANNYIINAANGGLSNFQGDLTGDGVVDVSGAANGSVGGPAIYNMAGNLLGRAGTTGSGVFSAAVGPSYFAGAAVAFMRGVNSVTFSDSRINQGLPTTGWIDLTAQAQSQFQVVRINRLIFDNASVSAPTGVVGTSPTFTEWQAIPEPSSLGLLALGAGGLLTRRRRAMAA